MSFLGIIEPDRAGRWHWPFRTMQEGDWFLVDWEQRDPESVRNLAAVKGSQLGKGMKIEKRPAEHPGFTRVTCFEQGTLAKSAPPPDGKVNYELAGVMLDRSYGFDVNKLAWTAMEEGQMQEVAAVRENEVEREMVEVDLPPRWRFELHMLADRIRLRCVRAPERAKHPEVDRSAEPVLLVNLRPKRDGEDLSEVMS